MNDREELIATAALSAASYKESMANVIRAIDKISNSDLRKPLLQWLYFRRATIAVKDKKFEEAESISSRVEGQEQRAYLHTARLVPLMQSGIFHSDGIVYARIWLLCLAD